MKDNSSITFRLPMEGERLAKVTQYGIQYPDGTIEWANAENISDGGEAVVIKPSWVAYNYYLAGSSGNHREWGVAGLRTAYHSHMVKQHADSWHLDIVKRTIVIAICSPEEVEATP